MRRIVAVLLFVGAQGVAAQRAPAAKPASVEGDAYLVMKSGDTKRGAGNTIYLLRDTPVFRLELSTACSEFSMRAAPILGRRAALSDSLMSTSRSNIELSTVLGIRIARQDSLLNEAIGENNGSILASIDRSILDSARTGMAAHYKFSRVMPGKYVLYGRWVVGDSHYHWWAPLDLRSGEARVLDLDNSVEATSAIFCGRSSAP